MNLLGWYIARSFLRNLFFCVAGVEFLVLVSVLFGNINAVFSSWQGFVEFFREWGTSFPRILELLLPLCVILSTALTFVGFSRSQELNAMKTGGMSRLGLIVPLFLCLIPVSGLFYLNQNYLYRWLEPSTQTEQAGMVKHRWATGSRRLTYVSVVDNRRQQVFGVTRLRWASAPFRLNELQTLARGTRGDGKWHMQDVRTRTLVDGTWQTRETPELTIEAEQFEVELGETVIDARHTPLLAVSERIALAESRAQPTAALRFAWHQKLAALAAPFVMVLLGAPLSQLTSRAGRTELSFVIIIVLGVMYVMGTEILFLLGQGLLLSPIVATWSANAIAAALGTALLLRSR